MVVRSSSNSAEIEDFRGGVRRVLDSSGFAGAKQLQAFLSYSSEAVFQGRSSIEQIEIAREVLGRGEQFNPLDDPSVRKMASLLRQRLQRYYETDGARDPVVISLPLRSYLPKFEYRDDPEAPVQEPENVPSVDTPERELVEKPRGMSRWAWAILLLAVGCICGYALHWLAPMPKAVPKGEFHLRSTRGDVINQDFPRASRSLLFGPEIGETDEVVVRMRFRPTQSLHQAGLLIFDNVDNYVEFGRIFRGRPFLEFAAENLGRHQKSEAQVLYDPDAQTLTPVWLAIRRNGNTYQAFTSGDGIRWAIFGEPRTLTRPLLHPRVGLFSFHGNTKATPEEAVFDHLSVGPGLHDRPQNAPLESTFGGWLQDKSCRAVSNPVFEGVGVRFTGLLSPGKRCTGEIARPVPPGDWTFSTRLDFVPANGLLSGLQVRGSKLRFRIVRWSMNGNTIGAELVHKEQAYVPDFAGSPPVILRISCRNGVLEGSFSRDDVEYTRLALTVPLASLGAKPVIGYQLGLNGWIPEGAPPPLVYWIHHDIDRLEPLN